MNKVFSSMLGGAVLLSASVVANAASLTGTVSLHGIVVLGNSSTVVTGPNFSNVNKFDFIDVGDVTNLADYGFSATGSVLLSIGGNLASLVTTGSQVTLTDFSFDSVPDTTPTNSNGTTPATIWNNSVVTFKGTGSV